MTVQHDNEILVNTIVNWYEAREEILLKVLKRISIESEHKYHRSEYDIGYDLGWNQAAYLATNGLAEHTALCSFGGKK